jgi:hypothetical protein
MEIQRDLVEFENAFKKLSNSLNKKAMGELTKELIDRTYNNMIEDCKICNCTGEDSIGPTGCCGVFICEECTGKCGSCPFCREIWDEKKDEEIKNELTVEGNEILLETIDNDNIINHEEPPPRREVMNFFEIIIPIYAEELNNKNIQFRKKRHLYPNVTRGDKEYLPSRDSLNSMMDLLLRRAIQNKDLDESYLCRYNDVLDLRPPKRNDGFYKCNINRENPIRPSEFALTIGLTEIYNITPQALATLIRGVGINLRTR